MALLLTGLLPFSGCGDPCSGGLGYRVDADLDGVDACEDCNDNDASVYPGADETCDGVDQDCDGSKDEGATDAPTWYRDQDEDSHGIDSNDSTPSCERPSGFAASNDDCDDQDSAIFPGAVEKCNEHDDDCDGATDEGTQVLLYLDSDEDGFGSDTATAEYGCEGTSGYATNHDDCRDDDGSRHPGAAELCNTVDDDCDQQIDEDFDVDSDGYFAGPSCDPDYANDCDDTSPDIHPDALEVCDQQDNDCDQDIDEGLDVDNDGFCSLLAGGEDCNDLSSEVRPNAVDACDGIDNDCSGTADEGYDEDSDGETSCAGDCNDQNALINTEAQELCDEVDADEDCNGLADDEDSGNVSGASLYYPDADGDGFGAQASVSSCEPAPSGYVASSGDCNDSSKAVYPGAKEVCDTLDNDCDGDIDEGVTQSFYPDADNDGFGDDSKVVQACQGSPSTTTVGGDCNDSDAQTYPGAFEIDGDGLDNNCDGAPECTDLTCDGVTDVLLVSQTWGGLYLGIQTTNGLEYDDGTDCNYEGNPNDVCSRLTAEPRDPSDLGSNSAPISYTWLTDAEIADLNRDGFPDFLLMDGGTISGSNDAFLDIYLGSAEGFHSSAYEGYILPDRSLATPARQAITVGDLDADGAPELVAFGHDQATVFFARLRAQAQGDGSYQYVVSYPSSQILSGSDSNDAFFDGAVADLNQDGYAELVVANGSCATSAKSYVYWNSELGLSSSNRLELPVRCGADVEVTDLNGDTIPDLIFAGTLGGELFFGYGDPSAPTYDNSTGHYLLLAMSNATSVTVGNVDNLYDKSLEYCPDLVFGLYAGKYSGYPYLTDNPVIIGRCDRTKNTWSVDVTYTLQGSGVQDVAIGDLNGDGAQDVILAHSVPPDGQGASKSSAYYLGDGYGEFLDPATGKTAPVDIYDALAMPSKGAYAVRIR